MTRTLRRQARAAIVGGIVAASAMVAGAAQSAVTYAYHQTASTPGDLPIAIEMTFANPSGPIAGNVYDGDFAGLVHFSFRTTGINVGLQDFLAMQAQCDANPSHFLCNLGTLSYDLRSEAGSVRYNNTSFDFAFSYGDGSLRGAFNTDFPGPAACRLGGVCTYEGAWRPAVAAVSEPATLALLLAGLLGVVRRGKRAAGRSALAS